MKSALGKFAVGEGLLYKSSPPRKVPVFYNGMKVALTEVTNNTEQCEPNFH
jgi:hypothetical protein